MVIFVFTVWAALTAVVSLAFWHLWRLWHLPEQDPTSTPQGACSSNLLPLDVLVLMAVDQKISSNCSSLNRVTVAHPLRVCTLEEEEEEDEEEADDEDGEDRTWR